jgi:hypothetical protein
VHGLGGEPEGPRRRALEVEEIRDAVALVAPAGDESFSCKLFDDSSQLIDLQETDLTCLDFKNPGPSREPGRKRRPQPADLPAGGDEAQIARRIEAQRSTSKRICCSDPICSAIVPDVQQAILGRISSLALLALGGLLLRPAR